MVGAGVCDHLCGFRLPLVGKASGDLTTPIMSQFKRKMTVSTNAEHNP